jgi:uncharacterized membrane protein YkoI
MLAFRLFPITILLGLLAAPAMAANPPPDACLNKAEQRTAVAEHAAISLGHVIKFRREHGHNAELVRAKLCHHDNRLVYKLTLLGRSGKVIRETVDAANGETINGH